MNTKNINIAIIGAGKWSQMCHIPAIKYLEKKYPLHITGIWNRTIDKAVEVSQKYQINKVYKSLNEVINDKDINCFAIVIHPSVVMNIIKKLLKRNLPILCEKPPGKTAKEAKVLSTIVRVPNIVAFNRRYTPINQRFKKIIENMKNIYYAECRFYRSERYYKNFITTTGIHGINYMEYLFGRIKKVKVDKWKNLMNETNIWFCQMTFTSGLKALIKFLPCSGSSFERYEVHSTNMSTYLYSLQYYTEDHPGQIRIYKKSKNTSNTR
jgi:predicted dehydrogenase